MIFVRDQGKGFSRNSSFEPRHLVSDIDVTIRAVKLRGAVVQKLMLFKHLLKHLIDV